MPKIKRRKKNKRRFGFVPIATFFARCVYRLCIYPPTLILLCILGLGVWVYHTGYYQYMLYQYDRLVLDASNTTGMVLKDVYLEGQHYTKDADIIDAIDLQIGEPLTHIDITSIKHQLEELPWIRYAVVERLYPSTLRIHVIERRPVALWQYENQVKLIDSTGFIIKEPNLKPFSNLILLVGEDAPSHTDNLIAILDRDPKIAVMVSSAIRVSQRRWNIRLHNGIEIKLPENKPEKAWEYLLTLQRTTNILNSNVQSIDLRIPNKMYTRSAPITKTN
jgi:cell division protein FtsQ